MPRPPHLTRLHLCLISPPPDAEELVRRLGHAGVDPVAERAPDGGWVVRCSERIVITPTRAPGPDELELDPEALTPEELGSLRSARYALVLETTLDPRAPVHAFAELLRVASRAAPDAVAVADEACEAVHGPDWLEAVSARGLPIPLDALYAVHAVSSGDAVWLHTHGLRRCGLPELELLEVPHAELQAGTALLRAVTHRALVHGAPDLGASLPYGRGLACALVPWRYVHADILPTVGGPEDRNADHPEDTLSLVTWEPTGERSGVWRTAARAIAEHGDSPVFFLTDYETERMEALARLRWHGFAFLANHFSGAEGWRFLAKFGYGGDRSGTRREHLWFEVHRAAARGAEATLVNKPHQDLGMREGDRGEHAIERLTDFRVSSPVGVATPENLDRMLRDLLSRSADEASN